MTTRLFIIVVFVAWVVALHQYLTLPPYMGQRSRRARLRRYVVGLTFVLLTAGVLWTTSVRP